MRRVLTYWHKHKSQAENHQHCLSFLQQNPTWCIKNWLWNKQNTHPYVPEIIPSPWLMNTPYPLVVPITHENLLWIPVNIIVKIRVLKDLLDPIHDWLSNDVHCSFQVLKFDSNWSGFKLIYSSQYMEQQREEWNILPFVDKLVAWSSILYIWFAFWEW